jgi:hypothetical protein
VSSPIASGWATVDLDRALDERAADLAPGVAFEPAPRSAVLGARCVRGAAASGYGWIVLLEPDTEGRLTGFLARHGEGWAATWHAADPGSGATPGPVGPESIEPGGPREGPFRLRVAPATIER